MRTLVVLVFATGLASAQPSLQAPILPSPNRLPAPAFALKDSSGRTVKLKQYRGKVLLLDFWATWCHGCKEEIPWFAGFQKAYGAQGLRVVGVSLDDDGWKALRPFLETNRPGYQMVLGDDAVARQYGIESMPDAFLIDRKGRIAAAYKAGLVDRADIEKNIQLLLEK